MKTLEKKHASNTIAGTLQTPLQHTSLTWLAGVMEKENWSLRIVAEKIGYSETVLHRIMRGTYGADPSAAIAAVERYRETYRERSLMGDGAPYVHTGLASMVWSACDYARLRQQVVSIVGRTQRGKTTALKAYADSIGATVIFVRCPSSPSPVRLCRALCRAMRLDTRGSLDVLVTRLQPRLSPQHLIIIDEVHQVLLTAVLTGLRSVELLRELSDTAECGMVLCGTKVWGEAINGNGVFAPVLQQIVERGIVQALPDAVAIDDLRKVWTHYGLTEPGKTAHEVVTSLAKYHGMGRYTKVLQSAAYLASKRSEHLAWSHVIAADQLIKQLGN